VYCSLNQLFSTNQLFNQSIIQSTDYSINQLSNQFLNQLIIQSISCSIDQLFNQPIIQSIDYSINRVFNQSILQSILQSINSSINQFSINQLFNQPITYSTAHSVDHSNITSISLTHQNIQGDPVPRPQNHLRPIHTRALHSSSTAKELRGALLNVELSSKPDNSWESGEFIV